MSDPLRNYGLVPRGASVKPPLFKMPQRIVLSEPDKPHGGCVAVTGKTHIENHGSYYQARQKVEKFDPGLSLYEAAQCWHVEEPVISELCTGISEDISDYYVYHPRANKVELCVAPQIKSEIKSHLGSHLGISDSIVHDLSASSSDTKKLKSKIPQPVCRLRFVEDDRRWRKFENDYSALNGKDKTCPLSDKLWMDDLNHLLCKKQQYDLKAKWRDALAKVKRKRLPSMMYQMLSEAMNVLMTMNTQLYKCLLENLVGGDSADKSKPLFKKATTSGPNARTSDDPTNENKKESIKPTMKLMCDLVIPNVSYCWDTIAYYLNFPVSKKREIEQRNNRDPYKCCVELMEDWLTSGRGTSPKTWSTLVSTLKQIDDLSSVSETIEERLLEKGLLA